MSMGPTGRRTDSSAQQLLGEQEALGLGGREAG